MRYYNVYVYYKGKKRAYLLSAQNRQEAVKKAKLKYPGLIVKAEETAEPLEEKLKKIGEYLATFKKGKINRGHLIATIRQLAVMTNAGIPIHDALLEIAASSDDKRLKTILQSISEDINAGMEFSRSLEKFKDQLGSLTITLIRLGEQTGDMAEALFTLAKILEEIDENIRKFKKAIRYPIILLSAMAIAFVILISYVVPKFKAIFDKLHAQLPLPTKILLWLEHAFNTYGLYILFGFILTIFTIGYFYKTNSQFKYKIDKLLLKLYLVKDILYYAQLNRFFLVFSTLVKAGLPVVEALESAISMVDNSYLKEKLSLIKVLVEKGASIDEAFKETGLFENMIIQMVRAGESSGQLDSMLEKIAEYYGMKFNYILDNMSAYIEPIMLTILAGMVLLLALGIFLPMWDMARAVKGAG